MNWIRFVRSIEGSYRIIYYIKPDQIDILAVLHGAQNILRQNEEAEDSGGDY